MVVSNYFDIQVSSQISNNGQGTQVHILLTEYSRQNSHLAAGSMGHPNA